MRTDAEAALGRAELPRAQEKLRHAAALEIAAAESLSGHAQRHAQEAAGLLEKSARVAALTLHYADAADDLGRAAAIVAPVDQHERWRLTMERARMLRAQGDDFGDRNALAAATSNTGSPLRW